jgi:Uma2 family endonuclease
MSSQVEMTVKELARSPLLPLVQRQIDALMEKEQARRAAFHRAIDTSDPRYEGKQVEFINGEVWEMSPIQRRHGKSGQHLLKLLETFVQIRHLGEVGFEKWMVSLTRNDFEPDICFWSAAKASAFTPTQARFPAPDFIVEILSPSTETIDREVKFKDYAAHGIAEYWIIDPERQIVEQYTLRGDEYALAAAISAGTISSVVLAGFQIPLAAIFDADANHAALRQILSDAKP